jgi:NADPH:quinone reductase-like Zn-dependent oxidoreductase
VRAYELAAFGLEQLRLRTVAAPEPGPGQILLEVHAVSLNYRDLLVIQGQYNPRLPMPAIPLSDGAGVIAAVGPGVHGVHPGDRVTSHFVADWHDGAFQQEYVRSTLGTPGPGLAAEQVVLPVGAVVPLPAGYTYAQAATLPIAALTAWSALVTVGGVQPEQTVLTLGTGGVSIFALQLARSLGARVIVTSSSDEKLARARQLGAQHTINYRAQPDWEKVVLDLTHGVGVDLTVETAGPGTLDRSLKATRAGGIVALLGALTGRQGAVTTGLIMMKRLRVAGIMVDSRTAFEALNRHLVAQQIKPVIDREFAFEELPEALRCMEAGTHFGKLVVRVQN